jgi:hypothetical protein
MVDVARELAEMNRQRLSAEPVAVYVIFNDYCTSDAVQVGLLSVLNSMRA